MNHFDNVPFYYEIPVKSENSAFFKQGIQNYIFVNQSEFVQKDKMDFLEKIMAAVQLIPEYNALIVPVHKDTFLQFSNWPSQEFYKLVFFGIPLNQMAYQGDSILYQPIQTLHLQILFAKSLSDYSSEIDKKLLWKALKEMFL